MATRAFHIASMVIMFVACILYIVTFASAAWLSDDNFDYGFWKKCQTDPQSEQECGNIDLDSQEDYFEAARTFGTFTLVSYIFCVISSFLEETEEDTGMKKTCYRYIFCHLGLLTVILQIITMVAMAAGYDDDPALTNPTTSWCFPVAGVSVCLAFLACLSRFKHISLEHRLAYCCGCQADRAKTTPSDIIIDASYRSEDSMAMENGRSSLPPLMIRRTSSATSDGLDGRLTRLPPLPLKARGGLPRSSSLRSTDSGLDSKDISKDSLLDEATGPLPLSVEVLRRHDRRLNGATGRRDDRRLRPAFSSTTSLSTTDSQSSAELAPRVHTPTSKKRVHYNIPQKSNSSDHDSASGVPPPQPEPAVGGGGARAIAAPIISFPIKTQGVELSRASTNARTTATLDSVRLAASTTRKEATRKGGAAVPGVSGSESQAEVEAGEEKPTDTKEKQKKPKAKTKKKKPDQKSKTKEKSSGE